MRYLVFLSYFYLLLNVTELSEQQNITSTTPVDEVMQVETLGNETLFIRGDLNATVIEVDEQDIADVGNDTSLNLTQAELDYYKECHPLAAQKFVVAYLKSDAYVAADQPAAPLVIDASFIVHEIMHVDEMSRQASIQTTFFQIWHDNRLTMAIAGCYDNISVPLPQQMFGSIWKPSIRVSNAVSSDTVSSPVRVESITIQPTGMVSMRINMLVGLPCAADYSTFPYDDIECYIVLASWISKDFIRIRWLNDQPLQLAAKNIKLASFAVGKYNFQENYNAGSGTRMAVALQLHRYPTYFYLTIYIPSSLVVFIAWSALWFDIDGGRVGLCLTSLVTMNIMFAGVSGSLPKVGYMKGIDLWMLTCIFFVCLPMIQYAFIAYLARKATTGDNDGLDEPVGISCLCRLSGSGSGPGLTVRQLANWMDRVSRPAMFLACVSLAVAYFLYYYRSIDRLLTLARQENKAQFVDHGLAKFADHGLD